VFNGEPIVPGRLAPEGTTPGLITKITPGKRAMAVRINDVTGIAGMIPPNSRVDIGLTTTLANAQKTAKIFMSNMRVLMMQTSTSRTEDGRPIPATVATLEVTPEEFELLMVAQAQGSIQLVLRGYGDPDSVKTKGATSADVERALRDAVVAAPRPNRPAARPAPAVPETVVVRVPTNVGAPKTAPKPDSNRVEVFRGGKKEELKFTKDSVRRDTIPNN
jgi:pilus assembly protein CpaB